MPSNENGNNNPEIYEPEESTFKGHPTLTIPIGDGYGMTFGVRKAQAIINSIDAIRSFAKKHSAPAEQVRQ